MIEKMVEKMTIFYKGNKHDIAHFLKVWGWARTLGKMEGLDEYTQNLLEMSAVVHDIACPLCREKYGNANGKYQELESAALLEVFLEEFDLDRKIVDRIIYNVTHHHTYTNVEGNDLQLLLEADYLVNADEGKHSIEAIREFEKNVFKSESGKKLLERIYLI